MKCVLPSQNVKTRALHSLSRIGDDLFVEPHNNLLALRTVNMAQSAYAVFTFFESFFSCYNYSDVDDVNENCLRCKISMKSCLSVFKTPTCMDKQVEWCQIRFEPDGTQLVFKIRYVYGSTKTHFLPVLESETIHADYDKNKPVNKLCVTPKILSGAVRNFRPNIDEITLSVSSDKLILKSHVDNSDSKKSVRTELCLFASEFEAFNVSVETSVTFCLKEMKAVLAFAEPTNLPIGLNFDTHGQPIVFVISNSGVYEADYVISTQSTYTNSMRTSQRSELSISSKSCDITLQKNNDKKKRKRPHDTSDSEDFAFPTEIVSNVTNNCDRQSINAQFHTNHNTNNEKQKVFTNLNIPSTSAHNLTGVDRLSSQEEVYSDEVPLERRVFRKCFNTTFHNILLPGYDQVLEYDTDDVDDSY